MFELRTFPARDGDCLMLTWGTHGAPRRLLIDGGREGTWTSLKDAIQALPAAERVFELLVVTHIDADHIAGVIKMLNDPQRGFEFKEVWFNAYNHLREHVTDETFGAKQGEQLSDLLKTTPEKWNTRFGHRSVVVADHAAPPIVTLDGLTLTLLSPTPQKLRALEAVWKKWLEAEGLLSDAPPRAPDPPEEEGMEAFGPQPDVDALAAKPIAPDDEPPNGSSIAFVAQFGDHRVLLTGDAHPDTLETALGALPEADRRFDLVKLAHHGSKANISTTLLKTWQASTFLVSTNGSHHKHPNPETIARILKAREGPKVFYFNHDHEQAADWNRGGLMTKWDYKTVYPAKPGLLTIDLTALPPPG